MGRARRTVARRRAHTAVTRPRRRVSAVAKWLGAALLTVLLVLVLGLVLVPPLTRSMTDRWGATDREAEMDLPGDDYVADPKAASTKAVTVDAPPELVYKLLIQMGYKRGGWYSWDWFYKVTGSDDFVGGHANGIVPALQHLRVGDVIHENSHTGYRVAELSVPNEAKPGWMLLEGAAAPGLKPGNVAVASGTTNVSQAWFVYPADDDSTRLVLRTRRGGASRGAIVDWLDDNPLDFGRAVLGYETLRGIKRTAEKLDKLEQGGSK